MTGNSRIVHWWESQYDAKQISQNKWRFNLAKTVMDGNNVPNSNVIWQSSGVAPNVTLEWTVDYALNWTATLPPDNVVVTLGGDWQPCAPGESFDLDENGFWTPSASPGKPGWLSLGKSKYQYPGVNGIHIIVGVKNGLTKNYDAIYVDSTVLPVGSGAVYQPQEPVKWWLDGGTQSGSMYSQTHGTVDDKPNGIFQPSTGKYEIWTSYIFATGSWADSPVAPPAILVAAGAAIVEFFPLAFRITFSINLDPSQQQGTVAYLRVYLGQWYLNLGFSWSGSNTLTIQLGNGRLELHARDLYSQHIASGDEKMRIDAGLHNAQNAKDLPQQETWTIEQLLTLTDQGDDGPAKEDTTQSLS